jgi:hypothetical protein
MTRFRLLTPLLGWLASAGMTVATAQTTTPAPASPAPPTVLTAPGPMIPALPGPVVDGGFDHDHGPAPAPAADEPPCRHCWLDADYLLWWVKKAPEPQPLVTTGTPDPLTGAGVLGRPSTQVLFGGQDLPLSQFSGGRLQGGVWFGNFGLEGGGFWLPERTRIAFLGTPNALNPVPITGTVAGIPLTTLTFNGGLPVVLSVPLINALTGAETASLGTFPNAFAGGISASQSIELLGAEVNGAVGILHTECVDLTALAGFRYLQLREDFDFLVERTTQGGGVDFFLGNRLGTGNRIQTNDDFKTSNNFYGGQVGARGEVRIWRFALGGYGKVALGSMQERVDITGNTSLTPAGFGGATSQPVQSAVGGLLALHSNIGTYTQDKVVVVPEVGMTLGFQVCCWLRVTAGYSFLYASDVVRPGSAIDRTVNPTQLPTSAAFVATGPIGPARPAFNFQTTDFWAQGLNLGFALRF